MMPQKPATYSNPLYWRCCCAAMVVLSLLTFTPLVIPAGKIDPSFYGVPFTLWVGMLIAMAMIVLTIIAAFVHPDKSYTPRDEK